MSYESVKAILAAMKDAGWSTDSITFGSGGALLQKVDRDTQKCAYKCCMAVIDGEQVHKCFSVCTYVSIFSFCAFISSLDRRIQRPCDRPWQDLQEG